MTYLKKNSRKLLVAIILGINTDLAMAQSNNIDLDSISPRQALDLLNEMKQKIQTI